ncbi:MAG: hypothetical protein EBT26_05430 [Microbacteriaceae bacterium]|nr:hypothetical protein [Microbacteriaceae bacterium]
MEHLNRYFESFISFCKTRLTSTTAETISWLGLILIHAATVPTMLSIMAGLNDKMPPVDLVLLVWAGLALFFVRAAILKDMINLVTIGFGFVAHAVILALLVFK